MKTTMIKNQNSPIVEEDNDINKTTTTINQNKADTNNNTTSTDLSAKSSKNSLQTTTTSTSLISTKTHPVDMISPMSTIMSSKSLVSKFQLKKYKTPIDGNCGIQATLSCII